MKPIPNAVSKAVLTLAGSLLYCVVSQSALSQSYSSPAKVIDLGGFASSTALACSSAFQSNLDTGSDCVVQQLVNGLLVGSATEWANARGRELFGQHFSLTNRITFTTAGLSGELDAVIPVMSFAGGSSPRTGAFFLQSGVTRYTDRQGLPRNDLRYGAVRRFTLADEFGANVLGVSTFYQRNVEYGHGRLALGVDYGGTWGRGAFNYFLPTTDWVRSLLRPDREERPLEGMEVSFHLSPTNAVSVEAALSHWEHRDGSGRQSTGGRLGLQWRPHDWLSIGASQDGIGTVDAQASVLLAFEIPLGGRDTLPRWRGLGLSEERRPGSAAKMWRPVDNIGQIRVAERAIAPEASAQQLLRNLDVQFLQPSASSGTAIRVQVTLAAPVMAGTRLHVRLKPGPGDYPAVAGEDFVDEAVELVLAKGTARGEVTIQLLRNADMSETRSLGVTVLVPATATSNFGN